MNMAWLLTRSRASEGRADVLGEYLFSSAPVLNSLRSNVFVASLELELVFANAKAMETMRLIEPEVRACFKMGIDDILNGSIHRFHRDPSRVERILHAPNALPHEAVFSFGSVTLSTQINALTTPEGRIGYIVAWEDVSQLKQTVNAVSHLSERWQNAATTVEELGASIEEISRSSSGAVGLATESTRAVTETQDLVSGLASSANEITSITQLIDTIADQTHLLALNATIEAARAGEAGLGFAVVAKEVKELASNTASATERIARQVETIQRAVELVRNATDSFAVTVEQVSEYQGSIAAAVEEQAVVARELAKTISEAAAFSDRVVNEINV